MRALIYSTNFAPDLTGIGKYSGDMAAWLVEQGHDVRVVTAPPYYPNWKLQHDYASSIYRREVWRGVAVWRAPIWVPKSPSGLKRILHLLSFAITSFPLMLRQIFWRPDLVLIVAPAFVCAPTAWLTARLCHAQAWLHLQDFEIDLAFDLGLLKSQRLQRMVLRMERWMLRRFDPVSSISNRMVERLLTKGVPEERTRFFPNWVDTSRIVPFITNSSYRAQLGIGPDALVVLFSGTLGSKQGLLIIPIVAKLLAHRQDIVIVICGEGVLKARLEAETAALSNVRHLPLQPVERLGELLGSADIHLLPQSPAASDRVLPSKLSGMLASGRAIIATTDKGTEIDAVVSQCGVVVPPEDSVAVSEAILSLAADPITRLELGRRARVWAEDHLERNAVLGRMFGSVETSESIDSPVVNSMSELESDSMVGDDSAVRVTVGI